MARLFRMNCSFEMKLTGKPAIFAGTRVESGSVLGGWTD
jgi:hypothetical protein